MAESQTLVRFQWLGLAMAALGVVWLMWPGPQGDPRFDPRVFHPAFTKTRAKPVVLIDEAHSNLDTAWGRYRPFAELLRNDGYAVAINRRKFDAVSFEGARVLVVADALGAVRRVLEAVRLEDKIHWRADAFDNQESVAVREWVRGGGSLLLIAGPGTFAEAAQPLAAQFAVEMTGRRIEDPAHGDPETGIPGFLLFSRDNGLLLEHAITRGEGDEELLLRVLTFRGQALRGPPGSVAFLKLPAADGLTPGLALEFGAGRVVVLGEDSMLTSLVEKADGREFRLGMGRKGYDNRQLTLNVIHWLTRIL